jgi:hypothetical protein
MFLGCFGHCIDPRCNSYRSRCLLDLGVSPVHNLCKRPCFVGLDVYHGHNWHKTFWQYWVGLCPKHTLYKRVGCLNFGIAQPRKICKSNEYHHGFDTCRYHKLYKDLFYHRRLYHQYRPHNCFDQLDSKLFDHLYNHYKTTDP